MFFMMTMIFKYVKSPVSLNFTWMFQLYRIVSMSDTFLPIFHDIGTVSYISE